MREINMIVNLSDGSEIDCALFNVSLDAAVKLAKQLHPLAISVVITVVFEDEHNS